MPVGAQEVPRHRGVLVRDVELLAGRVEQRHRPVESVHLEVERVDEALAVSNQKAPSTHIVDVSDRDVEDASQDLLSEALFMSLGHRVA